MSGLRFILKTVLVFASIVIISLNYMKADPIRADSLPRLLAEFGGNLTEEKCAQVAESISLTYSRTNRFPLSLSWLEMAVNHSRDSIRLSSLYRIKAQILTFLDRHDDVLLATRLARGYGGSRIPSSEMIILLNLEGVALTFTGRYEEAFCQGYSALLMSITSDNEIGALYSTANLALNYYKVKDYPMAIEYYKKALGYGQIRNSNEQGVLLANLALAYVHAGDVDSASWCLAQIPAKAFPNSYEISILYSRGVVKEKEYDTDSALYFFSKSLDLAYADDNHRYIAENSLSIAKLKLSLSDTAGVRQALTIAERLSLRWRFEDIVVKVYESQIALADYASNARWLIELRKRYILKDLAIYNADLAQLLARRKSQHLESELQASLKRYNDLLKINLVIEENQVRLTSIFLSLLFLALVFVTLLIVSFRIRLKHTRSLERIVTERSVNISRKLDELKDVLVRGNSTIRDARESLDRGWDNEFLRHK